MNAPPTWRDDAACVGSPTRWWYPEEHANASHHAKKICGECPVRAQCLTDAVARDEMYGIWGGVTFSRHAQRNARRRAGRGPGA